MLIAILNQSNGAVADADVAIMAAAIAAQIQADVAPAWNREPATVTFYSDVKDVPAGAYGVAIVPAIDGQPTGVVGYHVENWGVVAAQPILANVPQALTGDWSVSSTLSHEVLEMFIDPACNLWAVNGQGTHYSLEVCDPVEAPTYAVTGVSVANFPANGVSVSNFVFPSWFDPATPAGAQLDKLNKGDVIAPFTIAAAGYANYVTGGQFNIAAGGYTNYGHGGQMQQQFGTSYPDWRKTMKSARTAKPLARSQRILDSWHT
jgi:hypothetical protein